MEISFNNIFRLNSILNLLEQFSTILTQQELRYHLLHILKTNQSTRHTNAKNIEFIHRKYTAISCSTLYNAIHLCFVSEFGCIAYLFTSDIAIYENWI